MPEKSLLSKNEIDNLIQRANEKKAEYFNKIHREEIRIALIYFMTCVKEGLNWEQLNAIDSWIDHSNLSASEILEKLGED